MKSACMSQVLPGRCAALDLHTMGSELEQGKLESQDWSSLSSTAHYALITQKQILTLECMQESIQSDLVYPVLFYPDPSPSGRKSMVTELQHMSCIHTVCVFDYPVPSPFRIFLWKTDACGYARSDCIHTSPCVHNLYYSGLVMVERQNQPRDSDLMITACAIQDMDYVRRCARIPWLFMDMLSTESISGSLRVSCTASGAPHATKHRRKTPSNKIMLPAHVANSIHI